MKKLLLIFFLLPLVFNSCSSDDDDYKYSKSQLEYLSKLESNWLRYTGLNSDKIEYIKLSHYYSNPNLNIKDFVAMGECTIQEYDIVNDKYINYKAYYWVNEDASVLRFYDIEKSTQLDSFIPFFENDNKLVLKYRDPNHLGVSTKVYYRENSPLTSN